MVTNKCFHCFSILILEIVGQGRTQSTLIFIATNNKVRRQRRRVHRQRTIINNDYDDEIVITNVPNSTQTIFRDKKS